MRKSLAALATAATVAVAAVASPGAAEARWGWRGPGFFFGGLAAGALIAGAAFGPRYDYPYYRPYYGYYGPYGCWRRYWNGWRWVGYRVC